MIAQVNLESEIGLMEVGNIANVSINEVRQGWVMQPLKPNRNQTAESNKIVDSARIRYNVTLADLRVGKIRQLLPQSKSAKLPVIYIRASKT